MEKVTDNVYTETKTLGCNPSFITTSEGVVMIDSPQQPSDAVKWREEIAKYGPIRYLINTEPHGDHIIGNFFFETTVVAHELTREAFLTGGIHEDMLHWMREHGFASEGAPPDPVQRMLLQFKETDPDGVRFLDGYRLRLPTVTFSERMTLYVGNHTFQLLRLPGHTLGETGILVPEERAFFAGDNVFNEVMPVMQDKGLAFAWIESLKKIEALDVDYVVPGHGEVGNKGTVREMIVFLQDIIDAVQKAINHGWSREEAIDRISFEGRYSVSPGLEAWAPFWQMRNIGWTYDELIVRKTI